MLANRTSWDIDNARKGSLVSCFPVSPVQYVPLQPSFWPSFWVLDFFNVVRYFSPDSDNDDNESITLSFGRYPVASSLNQARRKPGLAFSPKHRHGNDSTGTQG